MLARDYIPSIRYGAKLLSSDVIGDFGDNFANVYYVDGDFGSNNNDGKTPDTAVASIQTAVTLGAAQNLINKRGTKVMVKSRYMVAGSTDPVSYAETIIIPAVGGERTSIIGVPNGNTQGGVPQIKIGAGSTAMLTVRAPGCSIINMGFNGASSTGGGILLDDDGSTKTAFGTYIANCHFKNCKAHATNGAVGGAIYTNSSGNAWQVRISNNTFYKNVGGIVVVGTGGSVPQDWIIDGNDFGSSVNTEVDVDIYVAGSGVKGLVIRDNNFNTIDVPTGTSGTIGRYVKLATGTYGILANNNFACITNESATEITFGAAGTGAIIPTTVRMTRNYGETGLDGTMESGEIFRT